MVQRATAIIAISSSSAGSPPAPSAGRGTLLGASLIATLIVGSLILYFVGDRLTPYTSQARVQAFVVPVAAEVSGKVQKVHVKNNDEVELGEPLFDLDPEQYEFALRRAHSDYECVGQSVKASAAASITERSQAAPKRSPRITSGRRPQTIGAPASASRGIE